MNLAIKGNATRGSEVIALLEMLGGINNRFKLDGLCEGYIYYICPEYDNDIHSAIIPTNQIVFSLEEFEEKFPYKVGDKVVYKLKPNQIFTIERARWNDGKIAYIIGNEDEVIIHTYAKELQPYKEDTMEDKGDKTKAPNLIGEDYSGKRFRYKIPNSYEFDCIKDNEIILKPKHPKYPKTYEECCSILGCKANDFFTNFSYNGCDVEISDYEDKIDDLLQNFRKLIYCRDAYWKIAGEQMGLGKSWEPNWNNDEQGRYIIMVYENKLYKDMSIIGTNFILVFPTEEMRDAFYENFKELIEACKELL